MSQDNYLLEYEEIKDLSIRSFLELLDKTEGKQLSELKVRDLSYHNDQHIWPGSGVYLFRDQKRVIYVGKVSAMSFTERIAKHFDYRPAAWMNRLLKLISEKEFKHERHTSVNLKIASKYAFENLNLVLINFEDRSRINRTERLFRSCTQPLNKFKNLTEKNLEKIIGEY
jgi:hypothetical protein